MSREVMDKLFRDYEAAFNKLDLKAISEFYNDAFISAGPKGVIAQSKKEFKKKAEQAIEFYKSVGQKSARIVSKRMMPICDEYSMVVVRWGVTFERTGSRVIEFDVTYIVYEKASPPQIILFISHEGEEEAMKKLGVIQKVNGNTF